MLKVVRFKTERIRPSVRSVLSAQGIPNAHEPDARTLGLVEQALSMFDSLSQAQGLAIDISAEEFERVFEGEGLNEPLNPVAEVSLRADSFVLFAVTLGHPISDRISHLFGANDFAIGSMLDSAASEGADLAADELQNSYEEYLRSINALNDSKAVLRYSPGYCGWHISGQKKLFSVLRPDRIGVNLTHSCLMQPIKSVSGVMIAADKKAFYFQDIYPFCADCKDRSCRRRIERLMNS